MTQATDAPANHFADEGFGPVKTAEKSRGQGSARGEPQGRIQFRAASWRRRLRGIAGLVKWCLTDAGQQDSEPVFASVNLCS